MPDSNQYQDMAKAGSILGSVVVGMGTFFYFVGRFFPKSHHVTSDGIAQQKFWKELQGDPRIRDFLQEQRDDLLLNALRDVKHEITSLKDCMTSNERLLRNIRDIARDTATANNVRVTYIDPE